MQKQSGISELDETTKRLLERAGPGSKTAMNIAGNRFDESRLPEGERICYDPYAVHFISPESLALLNDPIKLKAASEYWGRLVPGMGNSIRARVRYFDDFVTKSIDEGMEQLVILGAGYDTRAHRIEGLKGRVTVFEVDHPDTQAVKIEKIKEIFGGLPDHVTYVSMDLLTGDLGKKLFENGYDSSKKSLFLMEGLLCYLKPDAVDRILSFIKENSCKGSSILLDYFPKSVVDGSCEIEAGRNMYKFMSLVGDPLLFGIKEGTVETFLGERGFSQVCNVTSEDYRRAYFHGKNENRPVSSILSFAYAVVE
jgi:methyltransferase (TIGR00027 family)